jgi:hypothetical protein
MKNVYIKEALITQRHYAPHQKMAMIKEQYTESQIAI